MTIGMSIRTESCQMDNFTKITLERKTINMDKLLRREKNGNEKPKLDNARLTRIHFIDPDDQDYEETFKNSRRKLERPMAPAVPCKRKAQTGTTKVVAKQEIASQKNPKIIYGCIVESHETTRQRVQNTKIALQAKVPLQ